VCSFDARAQSASLARLCHDALEKVIDLLLVVAAQSRSEAGLHDVGRLRPSSLVEDASKLREMSVDLAGVVTAQLLMKLDSSDVITGHSNVLPCKPLETCRYAPFPRVAI
jgi:hypothetical protein